MTYEDSITVKVAWKYYNEGLTQTEIAKDLNISRMKVIKYLESARLNNIVQFKIHLDTVSNKSLEESIKEKYNLKDIYIVPATNSSNIDSLTIAASQYIEDRITRDTMINVGYGEAVSKTLGHLNISTKYNVSFVSLSGGVKFYMPTGIGKASDYYTNPNYNHYIIPTPLMVEDATLPNMLKKEKAISDIFELVPHSDLTVIGIGATNNDATLIKEGLFSFKDIEILKSKGAVGDLLSQFYDIDGNILDIIEHNHLISVNIELLKSLNHVVAIAGGTEKTTAIIGALKGKFIDVLITDEEVAKTLINY